MKSNKYLKSTDSKNHLFTIFGNLITRIWGWLENKFNKSSRIRKTSTTVMMTMSTEREESVKMKVMMTIKVRKDIRTIITEVNTRNPTTTNINHIIKITIIISKPIHNINTKINITIRISILISINNTRNLTINNNHSNRLQLM